MYDKNKAKILKVHEYTLGYCIEHNMLHEYTEKKFINKSTEAFGIAHKCIDNIRKEYNKYLTITSIKEFDIMLFEEVI